MANARTLGLSLLCSTFLAACGGQAPEDGAISAPTLDQTTFTLDHHYPDEARVDIEVTPTDRHWDASEYISYGINSPKNELSRINPVRLYQSIGNTSSGRESHFRPFLNDRQESDYARLRGVFSLVMNKVAQAGLGNDVNVQCEKEAREKTLTCTATRI